MRPLGFLAWALEVSGDLVKPLSAQALNRPAGSQGQIRRSPPTSSAGSDAAEIAETLAAKAPIPEISSNWPHVSIARPFLSPKNPGQPLARVRCRVAHTTFLDENWPQLQRQKMVNMVYLL